VLIHPEIVIHWRELISGIIYVRFTVFPDFNAVISELRPKITSLVSPAY
jgi:hypothetical protein